MPGDLALRSVTISFSFEISMRFFISFHFSAGRREPAAMEGAAPRQRGFELRGR